MEKKVDENEDSGKERRVRRGRYEKKVQEFPSLSAVTF